MFVGCRHPNGLNLGGVVLHGNFRPPNPSEVPQHPIIGGYGVTEVPDEVWWAWRRNNAQNPLVTNHVVLAATSVGELPGVIAAARMRARQSGQRADYMGGAPTEGAV